MWLFMKNKKKKKGAEKKSAPKNKKREIDLSEEYFIGVDNKKNNMPKKKIKPKKIKKLSKKQIQKRKLLIKAAGCTSLIAIILGGIIYIMLSPIFAIKTITVNTDGKLSEQEIISLSAITLNENTFKFTKKKIIQNIKENSYVDNVIIKRKLPNTLEITVKERTPSFIFLYGNAYVYINNQGYMLEISKDYEQYPIIEGIKTKEEDIKPGNRLCIEDIQNLSVVLNIMEMAKSEDLDKLITKIDISDKNNYKIIMDKEGKIVHLGDCSSLDQRMLWVKAILQKESGKSGDIIVNMNLNTNKPFFREKV